MVTKFVPAVRTLFKGGGFTRVENNEETGGRFLVGYRSELFCIYSDFQATQCALPFDAIGAGREIAMGAMAALVSLPPKQRIEQALKIAAWFNPFVCGPFHIEELRHED